MNNPREQYREETKKPTIGLNKNEVGTTNEYVIWLEKQVLKLNEIRNLIITESLSTLIPVENGNIKTGYIKGLEKAILIIDKTFNKTEIQ